ncbi:MAG: hypothetical protein LAP13_23715 [Acidobacteriia bacterium]|nr:hypothetical protein [Terriglobia bacterium]
MKLKTWVCAIAIVLIALSSFVTFADEHGRGRGHDKDRHEYRYSQRDRDEMKRWRQGYRGDLPPGLAKRDRLPPGLERQLRMRGTLPPGLRGYVRPCPLDLARQLPPPPPDCENVVIGGRIVLMNRRTFMVLDIFKVF